MPLGWKRRASKVVRRSLPTGTQTVGDIISTDERQNLSNLYKNHATRYQRSDLVYMCINRVAEMCAMQSHKLALFDPASDRDPLTGIPEERIAEHPFLELWRHPNPWDSSFELLEMWAISIMINGNAYWHLDDGSEPEAVVGTPNVKRLELTKVPAALWMIRAGRIKPIPDEKEFIKHYEVTLGESEHKLWIDPKGIRHFKRYHPQDDYVGLSPVEPAAYASAADLAAQKSNWAMFKNSMRLSGVVETERDEIDPDEMKLMEAYIRDKFTGDPDKAHQIAFLWQDFKYRELGQSMRDAEFISGAKLNRQRVFGVFGVHPAIILSEDVNKANALVGEYVTLKFTVAPLLERLAQDITPVLNLWSKTPAEAHFVGVVPKDDELESKVATAKAEATVNLIRALGIEEGIEEAKRQKLISSEVEADLYMSELGKDDFDKDTDDFDVNEDDKTKSIRRTRYP